MEPHLRTSNYVCTPCGAKYLSEEQKKEDLPVHLHKGKCGICSMTKLVSHIKNFNYLIKPEENGNNRNFGQDGLGEEHSR